MTRTSILTSYRLKRHTLFVKVRTGVELLLPPFFHSRRRGEGEVQVPLGGRGHDDRAHLHLGLLAHEPFGVAGEADQVPLACHLK